MVAKMNSGGSDGRMLTCSPSVMDFSDLLSHSILHINEDDEEEVWEKKNMFNVYDSDAQLGHLRDAYICAVQRDLLDVGEQSSTNSTLVQRTVGCAITADEAKERTKCLIDKGFSPNDYQVPELGSADTVCSTCLGNSSSPLTDGFNRGFSTVAVPSAFSAVTSPHWQAQPAATGLESSKSRRNVYVSDLPLQWNTDKLRSVCSAFGNIISAKVIHDSTTNESRGYGFVMLETEEQAARCVRSLNNRRLDGRTLICRFAHERAMPSFACAGCAQRRGSNNTPLIPSEARPEVNSTDTQLKQFCYTECRTQRCSGGSADDFGTVRRSQGNPPHDRGQTFLQRSHNVFIQGLPLHWNTDKLRNLCGTCGKVELAKVVRDATTSLSCGHGFVLFEKEEYAARCVEYLNGMVVESHTLTCRLAREKRNAISPPTSSSGTTPASSVKTASVAGGDFGTTPLFMRVMEPEPAPSVTLQPVVGYGKWPAVAFSPGCHPTLSQSRSPPVMLTRGNSNKRHASYSGLSSIRSPPTTAVVSEAATLFQRPPTRLVEYVRTAGGTSCCIADVPSLANACIITFPYGATASITAPTQGCTLGLRG